MSKNSKFTELTEAMSKHSIIEFPREACGIITKSFKYIPTRNISNTPKSSFIVDPLAILKYENDIWGFFHSHPGSEDPIPSRQDIYSTAFTEYHFIVGFADKFYIYWSEDQQLKFKEFNESFCNI